jgi:hypothetical protein
MMEQTEGDPGVNAELKDLPNRIKDSLEGYSRVKAGLKKVPKKIMQKIEKTCAQANFGIED